MILVMLWGMGLLPALGQENGEEKVVRGEIAEAVVEFLEGTKEFKQRNQLANLPRVEVSPFIGQNRAAALAQNWAVFGEWAAEEEVTFQVGYAREQGDLAGAVVAARGQAGPASFQVLALGLKRVGGEWRVGPSPGNFNNIGLGFDRETRSHRQELEGWMLEKMAVGGQELLEKEEEAYRQRMNKVVPAERLKTATAEEALDHFLTAVRTGKPEAAFIWAGGVDRRMFPGTDWVELEQVIRDGLRGKDARGMWRLLIDPAVVRFFPQPLEPNGEVASGLMLFLSPTQIDQFRKQEMAVRFEMENDGGGWRVRLPAIFREANADRNQLRRAVNSESDYQDRDFERNFANLFEQEKPAAPRQNLEETVKALVKKLGARDLSSGLAFLLREGEPAPIEVEVLPADDDNEDPAPEQDDEAMQEELDRFNELFQELEGNNPGIDPEALEKLMQDAALREMKNGRLRVGGLKKKRDPADVSRRNREALAQYRKGAEFLSVVAPWQGVGQTSVVDLSLVSYAQEGDLAVALVRRPGRVGEWQPWYGMMYFCRLGEDGAWRWIPNVQEPLMGYRPDNFEAAQKTLEKKIVRQQSEAQKELEKELVGQVVSILPDGKAPSEEEALKVVKAWRTALRNGDYNVVLKQSAVALELPKPEDFLANLALEARVMHAEQEKDQLLGAKTAGKVTGVSTVVDLSPKGGLELKVMGAKLFLVVPTETGPRVLVDGIFELETNGGKRLQNLDQIEALREEGQDELVESVRELLKWHEETAKEPWEKAVEE